METERYASRGAARNPDVLKAHHLDRQVKASNLSAGYMFDQEHAAKHLIKNGVYKLNRIWVDHFTTAVELHEIPGVTFNWVHFRLVEKEE